MVNRGPTIGPNISHLGSGFFGFSTILYTD